MIHPIPISGGVNFDVDETTARDGSTVAIYNAYIDRGGAVRTVPGCSEYLDLGVDGHVWAWYCVAHDMMLIVAAGRIWKQTEKSGALTEITGAALTVDVPPSFAADANYMYVAANSVVYKIDGNTASEFYAPSPIEVTSIAYIGGYLLANGRLPGDTVIGDSFYIDTNPVDFTPVWDNYNNETKPDGLQSVVAAYEQIYNIGRSSLEVTYIDGAVPFSVNKNASQHFGTPAPQSVAFDQESIYYISEVAGSRKIIMLKGGGSPEIISFPIDVPVETFERVDDAQGFIMAFKGQNGYALTFPTANAIVDEQYWESITLFYHLQRKQWLILAKWEAEEGKYGPYRGVSFCYVEPWAGLRLIGGRDGKLYELSLDEDVDYTFEPVFLHRWRDDGRKEWNNPREISLGLPGQYVRHPFVRQCGSFRSRQHEFIYTDQTDAGDFMRAAIKTGQLSHGSLLRKRSNVYRYDIQRGKTQFVLNGVTEDIDPLRS